MTGLGGKEEQDAYLNSLAEYRAKRRAYLKHFRLKKLGLIKVWYTHTHTCLLACSLSPTSHPPPFLPLSLSLSLSLSTTIQPSTKYKYV